MMKKKILTRQHQQTANALEKIDQYIHPRCIYIGDAPATRKLYKAEEKRREAIKKCAEEWAVLEEVDKREYWTLTIPQVLYDTLNNYQAECALVACEAYLRDAGYEIKRPEFEKAVPDTTEKGIPTDLAITFNR